MHLTINGEEHDITVNSVTEVVDYFKLNPNLIIAEVDGQIIDRNNWSDTTLIEGSKIELVEFIAGG